ncbi:MAG: hypothetical protein IMY71_00655, partial [Bacteroidetes bacterium]|nr:hypothetical protein [Bacteroidota bacterium]
MIHYRVSTIINRITKSGKKEDDFDVKLFSNDQPINARLAAIQYAESFIEVLYDSKNDTQSELASRAFVESLEKGIIYYDVYIEWYTEKDIENIKEISEAVGEEVFPDIERTIFQ